MLHAILIATVCFAHKYRAILDHDQVIAVFGMHGDLAVFLQRIGAYLLAVHLDLDGGPAAKIGAKQSDGCISAATMRITAKISQMSFLF